MRSMDLRDQNTDDLYESLLARRASAGFEGVVAPFRGLTLYVFHGCLDAAA